MRYSNKNMTRLIVVVKGNSERACEESSKTGQINNKCFVLFCFIYFFVLLCFLLFSFYNGDGANNANLIVADGKQIIICFPQAA